MTAERRMAPTLDAVLPALLEAAARTRARVRVEQVRGLCLTNVRAAPGSPAGTALAEALGTSLPVEPGTTAAHDGLTLLWLGPQEWLVVGVSTAGPGLEHQLRAAVGSHAGAVTDVSAERVVIEVTGPAATELLATGCALDLHPRAFPSGRCAQTMLAKAAVVLQRRLGDQPCYRLFVRPSFAPYLVQWLTDALGDAGSDGG